MAEPGGTEPEDGDRVRLTRVPKGLNLRFEGPRPSRPEASESQHLALPADNLPPGFGTHRSHAQAASSSGPRRRGSSVPRSATYSASPLSFGRGPS